MSEPEKVGVRMPQLIVIPAGAKAAQCGCGMCQYFVRDGDVTRSISISGKFFSKTADAEITVPGCRAPTATTAGLGFDHHIDCALREQFRKRKKAAREVATDVRAVEALAQKHGIKCSGAPAIADCNGDAVIAFLLGGKLFATPCSVHADKTKREIEIGGRARDCTMHALDEFLTDRGESVAKAFAAKAIAVRSWHTARGGITVPKTGHL